MNALPARRLRLSEQSFDLAPGARIAIASAAAMLFALTVYALLRWLLGFSPPTPGVRNVAVATHLATVIPAIPLGAYVILSRKGGSRHKSLGTIWLSLMFVTAIATLFIRNFNDGRFSWIHLFTLITFIAIPQAIVSARRHKIAMHKIHLRNFFIGALIIAGVTAFAPGRTMWQWAFGDPAVEQRTHG
jgi:uncharacterized membrane protein